MIHNTVQWLIKIAKACFEFQGCRALDRCDRRQRSQMTLITDNRTSIHVPPYLSSWTPLLEFLIARWTDLPLRIPDDHSVPDLRVSRVPDKIRPDREAL